MTWMGRIGLRRRRPDRARALAAAGAAGLDELVGAEAEEEHHNDGGGEDPAHLDARWPRASGPPTGSGPPRDARHIRTRRDVDPHGEEHGQRDDEEHVEVELRALGHVGHGAGRDVRTGQVVEERVEDGGENDPDGDQAPPVVGLVWGARLGCGAVDGPAAWVSLTPPPS